MRYSVDWCAKYWHYFDQSFNFSKFSLKFRKLFCDNTLIVRFVVYFVGSVVGVVVDVAVVVVIVVSVVVSDSGVAATVVTSSSAVVESLKSLKNEI